MVSSLDKNNIKKIYTGTPSERPEVEVKNYWQIQGLTNQKKIHLPTGQVNFFFTCPAQIPTCPGFVRLKFLYAQDLQTEIEVPLLTLR